MKRSILLFTLLVAIPSMVLSAPFIVSDPVDPRGTQCKLWVSGGVVATVPVFDQGDGTKICKFDLAQVAPGTYTVTISLVGDDSVLGTVESAQSLPLIFTLPLPAVPVAPVGLKVVL